MAKKLYFDFQFTNSPQTRIFPCTWPTTASGTTTRTVIERHGALMDALPAVTGGSPSAVKQAREVGAWFNLALVLTQAGGYMPLFLDFVGRDLTTRIPFLDPGNAVVTTKAGQTPIFTSNFAVRLRLRDPAGANAVDYRGVCYVQRQHSVEV
jgi:hypothetical protein